MNAKAVSILAALALALVAGCGGSSGGQTDTGSQSAALYPWLKGPSREFLVAGGDNVVQTFGREATPKEREDASKAIATWMRARAAGQWAKECEYMDRTIVASTEGQAFYVSKGKAKGCAASVGTFGAKETAKERAFNMTGTVDSLRLGEGHGYAQYHGSDGEDWVVPVTREGGEWKVASLEPKGRLE
jgi:hypothetical protein